MCVSRGLGSSADASEASADGLAASGEAFDDASEEPEEQTGPSEGTSEHLRSPRTRPAGEVLGNV